MRVLFMLKRSPQMLADVRHAGVNGMLAVVSSSEDDKNHSEGTRYLICWSVAFFYSKSKIYR